jgi:hypothetical protein
VGALFSLLILVHLIVQLLNEHCIEGRSISA